MPDVFISYRHTDRAAVTALASSLRAAGLEVWLDDSAIEDFVSIQGAIERGLGSSKALLAWYSTDYPASLACQWELTHAFTAAQAEGDARRRVLLINPEPGNGHIHPVELRDALYRSAPSDAAQLEAACNAVAKQVRALSGTFASVQPAAKPRWLGAAGSGSNRFFGRLPELWRIHSGLFSADVPIIQSGERRPLVWLTGMGGSGKSLTAETYALRFGAAYPGGVLWLRAFGHDAANVGPDERRESRIGQLISFAQSLEIDTQGLGPAKLVEALRRRLEGGGAYLWIVDDLPSGIAMNDVGDWVAPSANGRTLITTRSDGAKWLGTHVQIEDLDDASAYALLTHTRRPADEHEERVAREIARDLGNHALALELAAAAIRRRGFADFQASLNGAARDVLDFAAELLAAGGQTLPHRENANLNLSTTLLASVQELAAPARDFLRLAAELAPVPIERQLAARTLAAIDDVDASSAEDAADLAMTAVAANSLAREPAPGQLLVHTLVARAMRFRDDDVERKQALRRGAVRAIDQLLGDEVFDVRRHPPLQNLVEHAKCVLAGGPPVNAAQAQLVDTLYIYESTRGHYAEGKLLAEVLVEYGRKTGGDEHPSTLTVLGYLGRMLLELGNLDGALEIYERLAAIRRRTLGDEHPDTLASMGAVGRALSAKGELKQARQIQEQVLGATARVRGEEHADTLVAIDNLAVTLSTLGERDAARALQERVRTLRERTVGGGHADSLLAMANLAETHRSQGDLDGARALQERVLEERTKILGAENPETLYALNNLAATIHAQGDTPRARQMFERVLEIRGRVLGADHPLTLATLTNVGAVCLIQGDYAAARAMLERSLEAHRRVLGPQNQATLGAAYHLMLTLVRSRDGSGRVRELLANDLAPLLTSDPSSLGAELRQIREAILPFVASVTGSAPASKKPWWRPW